MRFYLLYKNHGLYDPVLDDTENTYVPIEPQEPEINSENCELNHRADLVTERHTDKTIKEPLNVPELDEKIKSKANFHEALIKISAGDLPESARFKLPISDEYDPEGKKTTKLQKLYAKNITTCDAKMIIEKMKQDENNKVTENLKTAFTHVLPTKLQFQSEEEMTKNESQYSQLKNDVSLETLKKTASRIVGESIDRALSLAKQIKQEIDVELEKTQNLKNKLEPITESLYSDSKSMVKSTIEKDVNTNKDYSLYASKTETYKHKGEITVEQEKEKLNVAEEIQKFESLNAPMDSRVNLEERRLLAKHDVKETIEEGTVRRRSEIFTKEINTSNSVMKKADASSKSFNEHTTTPAPNFKKSQIHEDIRNIKSDTKETEEKAFTLGLQTVPHIRRALLSSYNSNLLLKTFFLQLTKVMVALSKFLTLEQKIDTSHNEKPLQIEKNIENINHKDESKTTQNDKEDIVNYNTTNINFEEQIIKKEKLSGAKIAQIEGNKPAELTDKMDIVISELLEKTILEDHSDNDFFFRRDNQSGSLSKMEQNNNKIFYNKDAQYGDFFDERGKHFDRRKLFEILEEKTKTMQIKEMISKKYTTEYKSMKTNKQNGNIMYYVALVEAKHFPNFDEIRRIKNLYEHQIKTEMKNDENLVYVAIVEAHSNINEEAILKEQMRRQFENEMLINKQTVELQDSKDVQAIEIGTQKLSLANTAVIEPEKISLTVIPIEHKLVKFARSATDMEQISKKIAVQNIVHAIEPLLRHESREMYNKQALSVIEKPTKAIAEIMDVKVEESQTFFKAEVSVKQRSFESIEKPESVVEITEIITEEDEKIPVEISKPIALESRPAIEVAGKSVAEISEIQTDEANIEIIPVPTKINKRPSIALEKPILSVAETITSAAEYKSDDIIVPNVFSKQAKINVEAQIAAEVSEVCVIEKEYNTLNIEKPFQEQSEILHENAALMIAETLKTFVNEPKDETLLTSTTIDQQASVDFQTLIATNINIVCPEETYKENLQIYEIDEKFTQITSERPLPVAETLILSPEESKDNTLIIPQIISKKSESVLEIPFLKAPESIIITTEGPRENIFTLPEQEKQISNIDIKQLKSLISNIVFPQESHKKIEISERSTKQAQILMENCNLAVALTLAILLGGPMEGKFEIPSIVANHANILTEMPKLTVAEIITKFLEEPKIKDLKIPAITPEQSRVVIKELISLIKTVTISIDQCIDLELQKVEYEMAQVSIETQFLSVAVTLAVLLAGPKDDIFHIEPFITNQVKVLMEMPNYTLAKILINSFLGLKERTFETPEIKQEQCNIIFEKCLHFIASLEVPLDSYTDLKLLNTQSLVPEISIQSIFLTVASYLTILLVGPKEEIHQTKKFNTCQAKTVMEMFNLTAPEVIIAFLNGPKESNFEIPKILKENCDAIFNEYISLVKSIMIPVDQYNEIELPKINKVTPFVTIENTFMPVALVLTMLMYGPSYESFQVLKTITNHAKIVYTQLEAILTSDIYAQETREQDIEIPPTIEKLPLITIENCLFAPEMLTVEAEGPKEDIVKIIKPKCYKSSTSLTKFKAIEVLTILLGECVNENLKVLPIVTKKSRLSIEDVNLHIANVLTVYLEEPKDEPFNLDTKIKHEARVKIEELRAAEVKFMPIEEPAPEELIISELNKKQIQTSLQSSSLTVAQTSAISPIDSVDYGVNLLKTDKQKASINVETLKSVEAVITLPEEPKEEILLKTQKAKNTILCSVAEINLLAAENSIIQIQESENIGLDIKTDKNLNAHVKVEEHKALETTSINAIEPQSEVFVVPLSENKHIKTVIEKPLKTVAQVTTINTNKNETQELSSSKNMNLQARVEIEELKALETMVTNIEEPKSEVFQSTLSENRHISALVENPVKTTALVTVINTGEFESQINTIQAAQAYKHAKLEVESAASVAQHNIITAIEKTHDLSHEHSSVRKSAKSSIIESSMKAMAKINEKDTEVNILIEKPKSRPKKIEDIEIQASFKIPTPLDDSVNEVSAEYNVQVPQEENVYAEYGFGKRKINVDIVSEIYESIRLMKKQAFQKQSMEASLSLARELQTKIEMAEIDTLQEEFIKSGSISNSSSMASSPLTPILEEYFFNVRGPSLMSRYRHFQDVFEEASLKLKSKIHTSTIRNLDASLTLILQDLAMAHLESETNDVEVIELDDYEDIRNLHFSTAIMARSREESVASFLSSEAQSLKAMHGSSVSRNLYGYAMSVEDVDLKESSHVFQKSSAKKMMETKASKSANFEYTDEYADLQCSSATLRTSEISKIEDNMHINCEFNNTTSGELEAQSEKYKVQSKDVKSLDVNSLSVDNKCSLVQSRTMESGILETTSVEGGSIKMSSEKNSGAMELTGASLEIQLHQGFDSSAARSTDSRKKLSIKTSIKGKEGIDLKSPSPPTLPPTPLTDEYMFRLQTKMPEPSQFIPRDCSFSPESVEEDIILKGGLIPRIRTRIERILYSPPYITPPTSPDKTVPLYSKGGGKSGIFKFLS